MLLDEHIPRWDFQEKHSIFIKADPERVFLAIREVKTSDMPSAYSLLFTLRFVPDRLFGVTGPRIATDKPLMEQMLSGDPMPFLLLGEDRGKEIVFGGVVSDRIGRVWEKDNSKCMKFSCPAAFDDFHDEGYIKVAANMNIDPCEGGSMLTTYTRVRPTTAASRHSFTPYWYAIRLGGGMVRKAWLDGIRRCAESC